jgi:hypothetical protein
MVSNKVISVRDMLKEERSRNDSTSSAYVPTTKPVVRQSPIQISTSVPDSEDIAKPMSRRVQEGKDGGENKDSSEVG